MHIYIKNLMNIKQIDTSTRDEVLQLIKEIYVQIIYAFIINYLKNVNPRLILIDST